MKLAECLFFDPPVLAWSLAAVALIPATVFDIRQRRIPNWLTFATCGGGILIAFFQGSIPCAIGGALLSASPMTLPLLLRPGSIGLGDIKLAAALGALLGLPSTLLVIGVGMVGALAFIACANRAGQAASSRRGIPLAPFLAVGLVGTVALGP